MLSHQEIKGKVLLGEPKQQAPYTQLQGTIAQESVPWAKRIEIARVNFCEQSERGHCDKPIECDDLVTR